MTRSGIKVYLLFFTFTFFTIVTSIYFTFIFPDHFIELIRRVQNGLDRTRDYSRVATKIINNAHTSPDVSVRLSLTVVHFIQVNSVSIDLLNIKVSIYTGRTQLGNFRSMFETGENPDEAFNTFIIIIDDKIH